MARTLEDHLFGPGKKRILAIDGGGARGILACGILKRIETILANRLPLEQRSQFRLHQYFDLIGGTSTGSILAAGLAIGLSADDLQRLYISLCPKIFARTNVKGVRIPRFDAEILAQELRRVLRESNGRPLPMPLNGGTPDGELIRLGSPAIHTGFAVFSKRIDSGSAWTLTNNPRWRYYDRNAAQAYAQRMGGKFDHNQEFKNNGDFPLYRLLQASAAAPTYFESVNMHVQVAGIKDTDTEGTFVDGALSGRNTPALQMLMMARLPAFGFEWKTTEDDLMMISVGAGWWRPFVNDQIVNQRPFSGNAKEAFRAVESLQTMIHDSSLHALTMMQSLSRHPESKAKRWRVDGEIEEMLVDGGAPFLLTPQPLLRFRRMDVRLEDAAMNSLYGASLTAVADSLKLMPESRGDDEKRFRAAAQAHAVEDPMLMRLRELAIEDVNTLRLLYDIGARYAETMVDDDDFPRSFDPVAMGAPDGRDTAAVVDGEAAKKRGWFG
jgi:uncharacterized protein